MLKIAFHGGKCCGIKTIHGFGWYGYEGTEPFLSATKFRKPDSVGDNVDSDMNFFTDEAPVESTSKRFDRYLRFIQNKRPSSLVEVTLVVPGQGIFGSPQGYWIPMLKRRGFRKVSEFYNSNSYSTVAVFHLDISKVKGLGRKPKKARKASPAPFAAEDPSVNASVPI